MKFSLYSTDGSIDSKDLVAGSLCPELPTSDDNVSWIISIDNFKDNTLVRPGEIQQPQSARTIAIILIVVTLLSVITIMIRGGKRYTYVEPMVYLVLLAFLTIRLFLLWRISVFPPVISTTVSEFNGIFRNPTSLSYIILFLAGFYAVILTVKIFGIKNGSPLLNLLYRDPSTYCSSEKLKRGFYYAIFGEPLLLIVMAVVLRSVHFTDRFFCVLLPIVIFFVVDYLANRFYGGRYREKYAQDVDLRYLWVLMANSIGTTIYTFVMDGGFGIIFLLFSVTNITLRMIDAYLYKGHDRHKVYINRWIYTLSVFAIFILTFSKKILLQLLDGQAFAITVFIIMTVVYIAILLMFNIIRFEHRHLADKIKTMKIIGAGVLAIALFSTTTIWAPRLFEGNHIEYRLKVQSDDPGNVLGKLQSATAERKFLEASINDWAAGDTSRWPATPDTRRTTRR